MKDSLEHLKKEEISTAWKVVDWLQESESDLDHLDKEEKASDLYLDKLSITIVSQEAKCERLWTIYFDSSAAYHAAVEARERVRIHYMAEKARRDEENGVLDMVIKMFVEKVSVLDAGMKTKVNDHAADGKFDDSDIARHTDAIYEKDHGKLAANVAAEAGF